MPIPKEWGQKFNRMLSELARLCGNLSDTTRHRMKKASIDY